MYRGRIERDLSLWVSKGLLSAPAAEAMLAEYDGRESSFSVGRVLLTLAAILLSAAVLLLVAANWEALPRIARVVGIVTLIWTFYLSAALCLGRGLNGLGAALLVMGTLTFGGAIALVGQMYHLSGDAVDAMLVWFAAACVATIVFRSGALTVVSGFLSWAVFGVLVRENGISLEGNGIIYLLPLLCIAVIALVRYTGTSRARHLAYLLMLAWLGWVYLEITEPWLAGIYFAVGFVCFLASSLPSSPLFRFAREAGASPAFYAFLLAIIGLVALHIEMDGLGPDIAISAVTLAVSLAGIGIAGRMNGAVRYLGYAVFAGETLYLASETLGSILGTSGFFLISGVVVAAIAWIVIRLEKRLSGKPATGGI
ncbi:DUF2157 domain-containing protein [Pararhizobium antarcticum]|uniref:DUF2157 domain-containing protein n=1 Tax=Pararhizobium antarcticum TaxID=1798805 RepID=A0A657LLJ1_9HYPH|nr:DUF2157 domain-containing protein [Pararhizobium antarcticum]OJF90041.1 hypothetical protein AX760_08365 [Pararhizobium antarcticum]OJF93255.1 hypothetical protein AX761_05230 [Rhizobium sp. 58]